MRWSAEALLARKCSCWRAAPLDLGGLVRSAPLEHGGWVSRGSRVAIAVAALLTTVGLVLLALGLMYAGEPLVLEAGVAVTAIAAEVLWQYRRQ